MPCHRAYASLIHSNVFPNPFSNNCQKYIDPGPFSTCAPIQALFTKLSFLIHSAVSTPIQRINPLCQVTVKRGMGPRDGP